MWSMAIISRAARPLCESADIPTPGDVYHDGGDAAFLAAIQRLYDAEAERNDHGFTPPARIMRLNRVARQVVARKRNRELAAMNAAHRRAAGEWA
jgi:hypothetical protein